MIGFCASVLAVAAFVDPFIGTKGTGHCFPGAAYPFGLVQASPDTGEGSWTYCAGYQHGDTNFLGFSQTHLSGTGARDLLDFRFTLPGAKRLANEAATPGYYAATLEPIGVRAEVTVSEHAAIYRFTSATGAVSDPDIPFARPTAHRHTEQWVKRDVYAATEVRRVSEKEVFVKIGISATDEAAAAANLAAEIPAWDFDGVRAATRAKWEVLLGRIGISDCTDTVKTNFYTALYHVCLQPHNLGDAGKPPRYSTFSCWDTFRASNPLYTILCPEYVAPFVNSLLASCETHDGMLPILAFWGEDGYNMVGHHAVPIVCDAILKGFDGIDREKAYAAVKESLTKGHRIIRSTNGWRRTKENWDILEGHGYYPFDVVIGESVSRTLECAYDDACAARLAALLGKTEDAAYFKARSCSWTNVFDRSIGCVRGKDRWGRWREPFDPAKIGAGELEWNDFTEGNALQYTWHVLHDPMRLVELMGGRDAALQKLEAMFDESRGVSGAAVSDVTGLIGNYAHGNEPSHHLAWFYALLGRKDLAEKRIREICERFYRPVPDGLCGNDDCGQMSAWYVFACLGFYPFDPCGGEYVRITPQVKYSILK